MYFGINIRTTVLAARPLNLGMQENQVLRS